ncbi:MAG: arginine--tRNA ligase [Planctomycetia bacterium]|nr:arginine--tRNA ligase [Planctomycetia bacterium]
MILQLIQNRFLDALATLTDEPQVYLDLIRVSQNPKFGDYQANIAMPLAKKLGRAPRDVAAALIAALKWQDFLEQPEIAGPGFINLKIRPDWLAEQAESAEKDDRLGVKQTDSPRTWVIDFSAPNVAKPMHVGHIRSTVIGNSLSRILRFLGNTVIADNHLGDWGTQFGMIIYGFRHYLDEAAYAENPVQELGRLYRYVRQQADADPAIMSEVLQETSKLHHGDADNRKLWSDFLPFCIADIDRIYKRLGVTFDTTLGESFYNDRLAPLVARFEKDGVARESEGAVCIFLEGQETPMLIRKKDGAFLYATTDLATLEYRQETWHPDAILYVVDVRQTLHFKQLFQVARMMGMTDTELQHVRFGTVLGEDGRPFKTRSGDTVGLESLLDEAEKRALTIVSANDDSKSGGRTLTDEERLDVARKVGIGALIYADLSQNRESDYVFSYDKMLAMNGNTATYMQYAYARVRSIFAKGEITEDDLAAMRAVPNAIVITEPAERDLALTLLRFGEALQGVVKEYRPNQLTAYLYELANRYSSFFEQCPVLRAEEDATRRSRLLLCDLTAKTIRKGLELLGIETVERM